jgi:hypothetical protein
MFGGTRLFRALISVSIALARHSAGPTQFPRSRAEGPNHSIPFPAPQSKCSQRRRN